MLTEKVVLITGAKGGLGSFVTEAFLAAGATVVGVSRSIADSDFESPRFCAIRTELTNGDSARSLVAEVTGRFGRIDAAVHLVGGYAGGDAVDATADTVVERMFALNFWSAFHLIRALVPQMKLQGGGCILATGSRVALEPFPNVAAYAASKAALVALVRSAAMEYKSAGIRLNAVLPGTMDTKANREAMPNADRAQWVDPAQVAELFVHFAGDSASHVSGALIPIYGGEL